MRKVGNVCQLIGFQFSDSKKRRNEETTKKNKHEKEIICQSNSNFEYSDDDFKTENKCEPTEKQYIAEKNEIRTKWKLTSFLYAMNYGTMYLVLWLYLHDPFEVFPMLSNLRVMVFH